MTPPDQVEQALTLLVHSARVSPALRDAVRLVENDWRQLRELLQCETCELATELAEERMANEALRKLLHDIAVARRGNDGRVDEAWDELPGEIEAMWAALAEADDRPWLCPNCGHLAARHFIGACPEYERPATSTPRQRWGTCCPNDPTCEHSYMDSDELTRYMDTPLSDERPTP